MLRPEAETADARVLHERLPQEPPSFAHVDFKSEHIWVGADSLTLIDLDDVRLGDPALDMGHFLADWPFSPAAGSQAEHQEVYESFLAGYAPGAPKERFLRARFYEAIELVPDLNRDLLRPRQPWHLLKVLSFATTCLKTKDLPRRFGSGTK